MMTIPQILSKLDPEYLRYIARESPVSGSKYQKVLPGDLSTDFSKIRDNLINENKFLTRINGLNWEEKILMDGIFWSNTYQLSLEEKIKSAPKDFLSRCISKLLIFGVPSPAKAEFYIVPVEYIVLQQKLLERLYSYNKRPSLLQALNNYNLEFIKKMCESMKTSVYNNNIFTISDLFAAIINNVEKNISELPIKIDNLVKTNAHLGTLSVPELQSIIKTGNKVPENKISRDGDGNFKLYPVSLFQKGILVGFALGMYDVKTMAIVPDEIFQYFNSLIMKKPAANNNVEKPKMIEMENLMLTIKKLFVSISFLSASGKRRNAETLSKFVSLKSEMIEFFLQITKNAKLIDGSTTNYALTDSALRLMKKPENSAILKETLEKAVLIRDDWSYVDQYQKIGKKFVGLINQRIKLIKEPVRISDIVADLLNDNQLLLIFRAERLLVLDTTYSYFGAKHIEGDFLSNPRQFLKDTLFQELKEELRKQYLFGNLVCSSEDFGEESFVAARKSDESLMTHSFKSEETHSNKNTSSLSVLPDFEVLIDISANFHDILTIAEFSDIDSVDKVCVSKITKASLLRYLNKFGSLDGVLDFLTKASRTRIPDNVKRLILDVNEKKDEISIIPAQFIVKVKDRNILDNLLQLKEFQNYFGERISHDAVAVKYGFGQERVINAIRKKGYAVKLNKM